MNDNGISRRGMLMAMGVALNGLVGALLAVPLVRYLTSAAAPTHDYETWIALGAADAFPEGETRLATFRNPGARPWDGQTADTPCWVRRVDGDTFQVFAINCAHLGCPVRWFPQSALFMCPCHGGVYYADGSRASGPPERGLFQYPSRVAKGRLFIDAGMLPTPGFPPPTNAGPAKIQVLQIRGTTPRNGRCV
jgi:menaquinol-cytochrome c reductase iron-sulfur subunit